VYSGAEVVELIDAASIRAMGPDASSVPPQGSTLGDHAGFVGAACLMLDNKSRETMQ